MSTKALINSRKVCRTCLKQCESRKALISLFEYDQTCPQDRIKFSEMLATISGQMVSDSDSLPQKVCVMCVSQIRASYHFKLQVSDSLDSLLQQSSQRQRYSLRAIKQEPSETVPMILSSETVANETFGDADQEENMLEEITGARAEAETHSDHEIIDYEPDLPDFNDDDDDDDDDDIGEKGEEENPEASRWGKETRDEDEEMSIASKSDTPKGKSPDSGISEYKSTHDRSSESNSHSKNTACNVCGKDYDSLRSLHLHQRGICSLKKCRYCSKKFGNRAQLKMHTRYKHPDKYNEFRLNNQSFNIHLERMTEFHECTTCAKMFISKMALLRHHADCDSKCIECGVKIPRKDFYFKHLETVHKLNADPTSLECPFCMNVFHSERILQEHVQRLHPDENQSEHQSFTDTVSEAGESTSNEPFMFECLLCHARFKSSKSLNQHKGIKHKYELYPDGGASKAGPSKISGSSRSSISRGSINKSSSIQQQYSRDEFFEKFIVKKSDDFYRCLPCQKEIFKRSLMMHLKSKHAAIRSHRCELCPEAFFRADYRQRHVAFAHPYDYRCHDCDMQFDRAYKYDTHMTQHGVPQTHFKPSDGVDTVDLSPHDIKYIEDSSNFDYTNDDAMLKSIVSGERPLESAAAAISHDPPLSKDEFSEKYLLPVSDISVNCTVCQQEIQKSSIISHLLWKHAVKKPLKCPFCNERVVKNNARLSHMSRCHPDAYKCKECKLQFVKHSQYASHMWQFHSVQITTLPSSGEEEDLSMSEMAFITSRNEDEIIVEPEHINLQRAQEQEKKFACQYCSKKFTSSKNLLIHKSHKHRNDSLDQMLSSVEAILDTSGGGGGGENEDNSMTFEEFQNNWIEVISEQEMKCLVCDQNLKKKSLIAHIKHKHCTSAPYLCAICPERFHRPEQRTQHMSQNHRGIFHCSTCNIQFYRNSRYAQHMSFVHGIDLDNTDNYEVDLNVADLRFEASIRRSQDDDSLPSIVHETEENDPMEDMMQQVSTSEEYSRNEFMRRFIKGSGTDRHCLACDRRFLHTSIYHHIIHYHAAVLPFKCPFCDVRFERSYTRNRHLQLFHPKEYKCFECGLQFPKYAKYVEHMAIEHNVTVTSHKSPLEEDDLSSTDVKYVRSKSTDDNMWHEDENPVGNSTMLSEYDEQRPSSSASFHPENSRDFEPLAVRVKNEPREKRSLLINYAKPEKQEPAPVPSAASSSAEQLRYETFKAKYLKRVDQLTLQCLACERSIIRTSVCAHLRLWHASSMMFNCELCDIGFRRSDYRQRHMAAHHPNDHKCIKCNMQFHHSKLYKEHMFEAHRLQVNVRELKKRDEVDVPLEKMMFSAQVPENLRAHPVDENSKRGRRLSICIEPVNPNAGGLTYEEFQRRYTQELGDSSYRCTICDESLSKFGLKKHAKRYHATSKPYNCELCESGFHRLDERLAHMQDSHPFDLKCALCKVQFYISENYVEHMRNLHGTLVQIQSTKLKTDIDVPIQRLRFVPRRIDVSSSANAKSCSNNNPASVAIKSEKLAKSAVVTTESDDIPDDAELTREQFSKKFLQPIRDKNNTRLLNCTACNKRFKVKHKIFHLLHNHVVVRPFACELCDMRFYTNFKRVQHLEQRHPNDFRCQICNTQFEKASSYVNHMLADHRITVKAAESTNVDVPSSGLRFLRNPDGIRVSWRRSDYGASGGSGNFDESDNFPPTETLFCDICNVDFESSRSYRQHIRDHGNGVEPLKIEIKKDPDRVPKEALFQCDICERRLYTLSALNTHKKFKHGNGLEVAQKRKAEKPGHKFVIECQMCSFTNFRRDYVEHHIKQSHKLEFQCRLCMRVTSNFNFYLHHLYKNHNIREDNSKYFKCDECNACFKFEENLQKHKQARHGENTPKRNYFCEVCVVDFSSRAGLEAHLEMHAHRNMAAYLISTDHESLQDVVVAPSEKREISHDDEDETPGHEELEPPSEKRQKLSSEVIEVTDDDKLEYLNYMQMTDSGSFKCGICGKMKALRKYMLHHLKQHKEVPTYACDKCPERFVFKKKYEQHLKMHEFGEDVSADGGGGGGSSSNDIILVENDHPKFQESSSSDTKAAGDIRCSICFTTFKLTIMLNKHNSIWHAENNPHKHLTASEQKAKKNGESSSAPKFKCNQCSLSFDEAKYLENHQTFFCVHRHHDNASDNEQ